MSDELKPCPFCDGEAVVTKVNLEPWDKDWVFYGVRCLDDYPHDISQHGHFISGYKTEAEAIAAWNARADDAPRQTVDNAQADSRERLEADVYDGFSDVDPLEQMRDVLRARVHAWLVRQAIITEGQTRYRMADWKSEAERLKSECDQLQEQHRRQVNTIERLTAERDEWKTKCETRDVAYKQADAERKRYSEQIDELTAERNGLKARVKFQQSQIDASHFAFKTAKEEYDKLDRKCDELKAERDELQSIIDHMPKTEQECEACQEAHDRLMFNAKVDMDELRDKLREKQRVCDVQRDSFAKMEREYRELQDVCGELERALENLRSD